MLAVLCGCTKHNPKRIQAVDFEADSLLFTLPIVSNDKNIYIDETGRNHLLLDKKIKIANKVFRGQDKFKEANLYIKSHPELHNEVELITSVSLKAKDEQFIEAFIYSDPLFINTASGTYSQTNLIFQVEYGTVWNSGKLLNSLKLVFTEPDNGSGYKKWILSYAYDAESWLLIARERINTNLQEPRSYGYCRDTINSNVTMRRAKSIYVSNELLYDLTCNN